MAAGLTQAQALFAVLAGGAQARRERVYYRDKLLRSTLYSPVNVFEDDANNSVSLAVEMMRITTIPLYLADLATNTVSLGIVKTIAAKPEAFDAASNAASLSVVLSKVIRDSSPIDTATNTASVTVTKYNAVRGYVEDTATNSVTLGVTKL